MGEEKKAGKVKKGWVAVRVGAEGDRRGFQRFAIPIAYLYRPEFQPVLEASRDAYGYDSAGPLRLPCSVDDFLQLRERVEQAAAGGRPSPSHRVHAAGHSLISPCTRAKVTS